MCLLTYYILWNNNIWLSKLFLHEWYFKKYIYIIIPLNNLCTYILLFRLNWIRFKSIGIQNHMNKKNLFTSVSSTLKLKRKKILNFNIFLNISKCEEMRFVYQKALISTFNTSFYYKITFVNSQQAHKNSKG